MENRIPGKITRVYLHKYVEVFGYHSSLLLIDDWLFFDLVDDVLKAHSEYVSLQQIVNKFSKSGQTKSALYALKEFDCRISYLSSAVYYILQFTNHDCSPIE